MMWDPELSLEKGNLETKAQRDNRRLKELEQAAIQEQAAIKAEFSRTIQEIRLGMNEAACGKAMGATQKPSVQILPDDSENLLGGTWGDFGLGGSPSPDPLAKAPKPIQDFGSARSELSGLGYTLIPVESLRAIGKIYQEGQAIYKDGAVNARRLTPALGNHSWQYERAEHAVEHLLNFFAGDESEDHLAKVAWFCTIMREIVRKEKEKGLPHAFSSGDV